MNEYKNLITDSIKEKQHAEGKNALLEEIWQEHLKIEAIRKETGAGFISKSDSLEYIIKESNLGLSKMWVGTLQLYIVKGSIKLSDTEIVSYMYNREKDIDTNKLIAIIVIVPIMIFVFTRLFIFR